MNALVLTLILAMADPRSILTNAPTAQEPVGGGAVQAGVQTSTAHSEAAGAASPAAPLLESELVAKGSFARPIVSIWNGVLTVAAEGPGEASVWVYSSSGSGWTGGKVVAGSTATAKRTYGLSTAGGAVAFRYGPKSGGTWEGPGLWINGAEKRAHINKGVARLALTGSALVIMSKDTTWAFINPDGSYGKVSRFAGLSTGEKLAFKIAPSGTWLAGMNGYSKQDASVAVGNAAGAKVTAVAAYRAYPEMSDDLRWPDVEVDPADGSAWFCSIYGGQLRVQQVTAGRARWPLDTLPNLGPATHNTRCPPRLCAAGGRLWAVWEAGRAVQLVDVKARLKGKADPRQVCAGAQPAVTADGAGRLIVVYLADGGIRIRRAAP